MRKALCVGIDSYEHIDDLQGCVNDASGKAREFVMPNTDKTAVEIEWFLDVPVREDLYEYIVNE